KFYTITGNEYRKFSQRLLEFPERFLSHVHYAVVLGITYGYSIQPERDPMVDLVDSVMEEFSASTALVPSWLYVPAWISGADFQRKAKVWANHLSEMIEIPFKLVENQLAQETAKDSFVSVLIQEDLPEEEVTDVKWAAGSIYGAGVDTTASAISIFFLMMARNPEVQVKAQAELDAVVGIICRIPVMRTPLILFLQRSGMPHRAMEDDIHDAFIIPKGSFPLGPCEETLELIVTSRNMAHDPEFYADPMTFNPSRFIASEGHTPEPDPRDLVFGFGRRCKLLADVFLFMVCAIMLVKFTISKPIQDGAPVEPIE
ncbi:cytochrome P450, partial [Mycena vulgaris]